MLFADVICSKYESRNINISYVQTHDNLADIFTKLLPFTQFVYLADSVLGSHSNTFSLDDPSPESQVMNDDATNNDLNMDQLRQD
jgi:hypothetical protein